MIDPVALAAAQTVPVPGDVDANLRQHLRLVRAGAAAGARVVVFPELSLTGYELDLAARLAFAPDDARLAPLVEAAGASGATIVAGAPVRLDGRLRIGAFIIAPDGAIDIYTKHRLGAFGAGAAVDGAVPPAEATVFDAGTQNPLVRAGGLAAAVAVCADTGHPSHARDAAARGAQAYLASMFVIPSEFDREAATLADAASRHAMVVVFANYGGSSGGLAAAGRSAIWSAAGERLAALGPAGAGVVVAVEEAGAWRARAIPVDPGLSAAPAAPRA